MTVDAAPGAAPVDLGGAFPALVTPLSDPTTLDPVGIGDLVRRAVSDGASGVLVAGTTGEGSLLEPEQREELTALARAAITDLGIEDVPRLLAGASGPSLPALHADVARLGAAGADAVLVLPPPLQPLTPDEVADLHLAVAERAAVPTLAYHIPQLAGSPLTPDAVRRIAAHERIIGMKDSSPDADRRAAFVDVAAGVDGFTVLTGHAPTLAAALAAGVEGSITAVANVRLRQIVALHAAVASTDGRQVGGSGERTADDAVVGAGQDGEVARLQAGLTRLTAGIGAVGASVPAVLKAALQLDGILGERWCTPPLASVPGNRLDHVRTALLR
ncbi:MAG: dihydrodipicolinate synthase family protein [Nitriliruptor sp.]|nr:MAG: dihydrodipicolinate synthase family protein [Nitriliruptor sp.]